MKLFLRKLPEGLVTAGIKKIKRNEQSLDEVEQNIIGTLSKPRRRRQRGHGKTKDLIGRTIA